MAKSMGGDMLSNTGETGVFFDNALDGAGSNAAVVAGSIDGLEIA